MEYLLYLGGAVLSVVVPLVIILKLRRPAFRDTLRYGVLIQEQRGLIFRWRWSFQCSKEDHLTVLLNQKVVARDQLRRLSRQIPLVQAELEKTKTELKEIHGGTSPVYHDSWAPRSEPVPLKEPAGKPKKKDDKPKKEHPDKGVFAKIVAPVK